MIPTSNDLKLPDCSNVLAARHGLTSPPYPFSNLHLFPLSLAHHMLFPTDVLSAILCAIVGAAIMRHSHPDSYSVLWSARVAAVGGAILGIPLMLFAMFLESLTSALSETNTPGEMVASAGEFALGAASSAGAAALGCKVLILSLGAEKVKQGIKESAIAGAVGAAVWIGAALAFTIAVSLILHEGIGIGMLWTKMRGRKQRNAVVGDEPAAELVPIETIPRV